MATKQTLNSLTAPDGSRYVTLTDGAGNLAPASGGGGGGGTVQIDQTTPGTTNGVQVVAALPAGTNVIGHVISDTGSVTSASQTGTWTVQPGNTANTTAWKVDGSAVTQPVSAVSLPLPIGAATAAGLTTINTTLGSPLQAGGTVVVTGVATSANQTTMGTNQTVVQAPVAPATATATKANLIAGQYNSAVQAFTNGQQGSLQFDQRGGLLIQDGQAIPSVSVTSATTLFTVADTSGYGSISVQVTSAGTTCTVTYEASEDGITWVTVSGFSPGNVGTNTAVTVTSSAGLFNFNLPSKQFRVRVSSYTSGTVTVQGTLRKDPLSRIAVAVGNVVSVTGGTVEAAAVGSTSIPTSYEGRTTNKTAVTTGQYVRPIATSIGAAVNKPFQVPELDWSYAAAASGITNTTTAVTMVAAAGAGIRNYLTSVQLSAGALGAATEVAIRDGAGGTVIWRGFLSTSGGSTNANLSSPIKSTANTLLEVVTLTATITGAVYVNAQGYQAP